MADIRKAGKNWAVRFEVKGFTNRVMRSLGTSDEETARQIKSEIEKRVVLVEKGIVSIPPSADVVEYCLTGDLSTATSKPLDEHIRDYLTYRRLRSNSGQISWATYKSDEVRLEYFQDWLTKTKNENTEVSTPLLRDYQTHVFELLADGKIGEYDAFHKLRTLKAFVQHLWDEEILDNLPRCLKRYYSEIKLPRPKPTFFTKEDIHLMLGNATDYQRLFVLCGLNFGWLPSDIASLTPEMIDFERGMVERTRHKTDNPSHHKMWTETAVLLRRLGNGTHGKPLLIRPNGQPIQTDGTYKCYVRTQFKSLLTKINRTKSNWQFKMLRKTSAQMLAEHYPEMPHVVDAFLCHGEKNRKTHHYVNKKGVWALLDDGLDWLYEHLEIGAISGQ